VGGAARCVSPTNARATCAGNDEDSTGLAAGTSPRIAPHAQSPRRLPLANFTGVDPPIVRSHESDHLTPFGASGYTPERSGLQGVRHTTIWLR